MTDLRQLRHFVSLAETLNYRAAAERLHMSQPPLSASIRRLEEHLGCRLFERSRRGTALTPAGHAALAAARRALVDVGQFEAEARDVASGVAGTLTVGYVASAAYEVLPRLLPLFRAACPKAQLKLVEHTSDGVLSMVETRTVDIGLMRTPLAGPSPVTVKVFQRDPFIAALPDTERWRHHVSVHLAELQHEPFVFYASPYARALAMLVCHQAGFTPTVAQEASGLPTVVSLVKCGLGVALVPGVARLWPIEGVVFKPLLGVSSDLDMALAVARLPDEPSALARQFCDLLEHTFPLSQG
ncbi:LysR family transcriptional regulator [Hydrogenophaga sp.]|uniref:LysR family transcriptional regulator n=1 Tax=Hydrogenophaga sp. TaxID=1904254 RepID=UPI002717A8B7|nr:LysR family transcriptional regulator [Hydrogenophaga sp.]MDO9438885.1 LysR family transcriptional regulator [Hydrogenophaga sp.]